MNIKESIFDAVRMNPAITMIGIARMTGIQSIKIKPVLDELIAQGKVAKSNRESHMVGFTAIELNDNDPRYPKYFQKVALAESLEERKLWNRAATAWREAFDATLRQDFRERARQNRDRCIKRCKRPCMHYDGMRIATVVGLEEGTFRG